VTPGASGRNGLIVGAGTLVGAPCDGHTLNGRFEQTRILLESIPGEHGTMAVLASLGYCGDDAEVSTATLIHRGRYRMSSALQRLAQVPPAIESIIGHLKQDHGLKRRWHGGATGDALHTVRWPQAPICAGSCGRPPAMAQRHSLYLPPASE
jgi:transposase, IS5 family